MKNKHLFSEITLIVLLFLMTNHILANKFEQVNTANHKTRIQKSYDPRLFFLSQLNTSFSTDCPIQLIPFFEGFNVGSSTLECWTIKNENKDFFKWTETTITPKEGDQTMQLYGTSNNDDWIISPTLSLDAKKVYKLGYSYKTDSFNKNEMELLASNSGIDIVDFNKVLVPKRIYTRNIWQQEIVYISNYGGNINLAWHNSTKGNTEVYFDEVFINEIACMEPINLNAKDISTNSATLFWEDSMNSSWEYQIQPVGSSSFSTTGTITTKNEVKVTQDVNGNNLKSGEAYEFFVRAKCSSTVNGEWIGPFLFSISCNAQSIPFKEGFNSDSTSLNCWRLIDNNRDEFEIKNNIWSFSNTNFHEGDGVSSFKSPFPNKTNDDWLISPTFSLDGGVYALTYYYKTSIYNDNEFEVLLSQNGNDPVDFTTVLEPKSKKNGNLYKKKVLFFQGINSDVNIAWHANGEGKSDIYIDLVTLEKVPCASPEDEIEISQIGIDRATLKWTDANSEKWEYFVRPSGSSLPPTKSGTITSSKEVTVTKTSETGSPSLLPDSWYDFFIRGNCGGGESSLWIGPISFKTDCVSFNIPFWEGFNFDSTSVNCWTIVDNNKDSFEGLSSNLFALTDFIKFEGTRSMNFMGSNSSIKHDDWLISPSFTLEANKFYRLKYHYKSDLNYSDFEVLLSDNGTDLSNFKKVLIKKEKGVSNDWQEEVIVIKGFNGNAKIAWHNFTDNYVTKLFIDNVFLEEIVGCPEPVNLGVEYLNSTTIFWSDEFGKDWEYYVQKSGGVTPITKGVPTVVKKNIVSNDYLGKPLESNVEYEFYVRTKCDNGEFSVWVGPYKFSTPCSVYSTPFWEGFNTSSKSFKCWTILDNNMDASDPIGEDIWKISNTDKYEGNFGMQYVSTKTESDDWLISPTIELEKNKIYRLKYHFKTTTKNANSDFELLASNTGIKPENFNIEIIKNQAYQIDIFQENIIFIKNLDGDVNLAWHVKGEGVKNIYLDNVFIQEVTGCPEPLNIDVKEVKAKEVTVSWTDDFNADEWEYYVQTKGSPAPASNGTITKTKDNTITKDQLGKTLEPNSEYEFYVRTDCGNGTYSIWTGPFYFHTECDIYSIPFKENFNTDSKTLDCWSIIDNNNDFYADWGINKWALNKGFYYEGDQSMVIVGIDIYGGVVENDDWLISPSIVMDNSDYVLKYHYKTNAWDGGGFEVLLSKDGTSIDKFTKEIVKERYYTNDTWKEEVVFFKGTSGIINLAWYMNFIGISEINIDKITLKKVENCPEPYYIVKSNQTASSIDLEWEQDGGITSWEVIVVKYGEDSTAIPLQSFTVTGSPKTTVNGLSQGGAYTIFVRAKCIDGKSNSDWSTSVDVAIEIGPNDDCNGAIAIPVNTGVECEKTVIGSIFGSTKSTTIVPSCKPSSFENDVWFEFTALSEAHLLSLKDFASVSGITPIFMSAALYDVPCSSITSSALACYEFSKGSVRTVLSNLTPGKKYYLRFGVADPNLDYIFNICITTSEYSPTEIIPSGGTYTVEELVSEVLIKSNCDLVSNIRYQNGDGGVKAMIYNTLGYFNKKDSDFPFEEGIVLSTNEAQYIEGPYKGPGAWRGNNDQRWAGDIDINNAIDDSGGGPYSDKRVTQIEFDFIPIKEEIKFDYLFASNSYHEECGEVCSTGALFAAWLVDTTTGQGENLAKVPETNIPIAINTIRDVQKSGAIFCESIHSKWFDKYYDNETAIDAGVDFAGLTKPMSSELVKVVPGRKYHIKLAVIDFCPNVNHSSAVFFNAGSFDLGNLDLGADLLVENGTALCGGEARIIKTGLGDDDITIKWYQDEIEIVGENQPDLEVSETGNYKVIAHYDAINCDVIGEIKVEIFPKISTVVHKPLKIEVCEKSLSEIIIELTESESNMFSDVDRNNYDVSYYNKKELADLESNPINTLYYFDQSKGDTVIYVRVEDKITGCMEVFELPIVIVNGEVPIQREDVVVCESYTFPDLEDNQSYYSSSKGEGVQYRQGSILEGQGKHQIYILQRNDEKGCYEEISYYVTLTEAVDARRFEDRELSCELYQLQPLPKNSRYYLKPNGEGEPLIEGSFVLETQKIYVYAVSEDGVCIDESSFTISYQECPIPKGISPNGDGINDALDLTAHRVRSLKIFNRFGTEVYSYGSGYTNEWVGQDKQGNKLPDGTYFYVVITGDNGGENTRSGWVQINR